LIIKAVGYPTAFSLTACVLTFILFTLGRHVHGAKRGPDKRFLPDLQQPALVYPIRYNGADFPDARRQFLADHRLEDIAEWLDLLIWVDSLYRVYAGYIYFKDETHTCKLQIAYRRRDAHGRYLPGENSDRNVRRERRRIALALAHQLIEELCKTTPSKSG
jgi:hypothetical protein